MRVAVDIGGTFTDIVAFDGESGEFRETKCLSEPGDLIKGILAGADRLADPAAIDFFCHGTTVGLNALLERRGARVALLTTAGFRDVYEIGRANRPDMYNLFHRRPEPLVRRRDVFEARERLLADGSVIEPLDPASLEPLLERLDEGRYDSVAICFLHAYACPDNERAAAALLQDRFPALAVSLSSDLSPEWREYERTSTVVANAYIAPAVSSYLQALTARTSHFGSAGPPYVMQSNGGLVTADRASRECIQTLFSGPVGGTIAARAVGTAIGAKNLICVDLGGTSFDVSLVVDGQAEVATQTTLEGFPLLMSSVPIHTIGTGGGSVVWLEQGAVRVGPRSAGSDPGPVCYARGGQEPTLTDANLVLGRIDPSRFLGGRMQLDAEGAARALERIGGAVGLGVEELAEGVTRIVNVKMGNAIRALTVERGLDPREFTLIAFGGAGPLHAAQLADEVGVDRVVIPVSPGTLSARGMLQCDMRRDFVQAYHRALPQADPDELERGFAGLEERALAAMIAEGVPGEATSVVRAIDLRYRGQEHFLSVPVAASGTAIAVDELSNLFHATYDSRYGHSSPAEVVEAVNLRATAVGLMPHAVSRAPATSRSTPAPAGLERSVFLDGIRRPVRYSWRSDLSPGDELSTAMIVEEESSTTFIPDGWVTRVDAAHNLILARPR